MELLTKPFLGEYVETSDSIDFLRVRGTFFHYLFWNDELYVSHEDFNSLLETSQVDEDQEDLLRMVKRDFVFPEGKSLQLWYRGGVDEQDRWHFIHLETGLEFIRPDWKEAFIRVKWDGLPNGGYRYTAWFNLCYGMAIDTENIKLLAHLCTKRMKVHFMNEVDSGIMELIKSVYNGHPFFFDKKDNYHVMSTPELQTSDDYVTYQEGICGMWDRKLAELGIVVNTNPKKERLTTGENYKDIVTIANMQRLVLDQLKLFALEASDRWGLNLSFAINGTPEGMPMENDSEKPEMGMNQSMDQKPNKF